LTTGFDTFDFGDMSKENQQQLAENLQDQRWRLNNLYWVINEDGKKVKFVMNKVQEWLYDNLWFLTIILKARQHGVSTFILILFLDICLFQDNVHCGFVAHNKEDAEYIFEDKAKFAYNNLPDYIRKGRPMNTDTANEMKFNNGSLLRVATSLRSGTYQYVHVSELGKICAKYPDKADEIVTGTFNAVHAGQFIFVESTAEGRSGHFFRLCKLAQDTAMLKRSLSSLDWKFMFFGWQLKDEYVLDDDQVITTEMKEYFEILESQGCRLSRRQKNWYIAKERTLEEKMKQEFPSTPQEAFEKAIVGSYYARQMIMVRKTRRITIVPYEPILPVITAWDIGVDDSTNIIFAQIYQREKRIIDFYENNSEGIAHYVKVLTDRKYVYDCHFFPHDIKVRDFSTGKSRIETLASLLRGQRIVVVPRLPVIDGIEAVRSVLPTCWFDEEKTSRLITALDEYRKEWDDKNEVFRDKPLHNWASNPADAMRIFASVIDTYYLDSSPSYGSQYNTDDEYEDVYGPETHRTTINSHGGY
jgi:hypothetical protein